MGIHSGVGASLLRGGRGLAPSFERSIWRMIWPFMDFELLISTLRWCAATGLLAFAAFTLATRLGPAAGRGGGIDTVLLAILLTVLLTIWPVALFGALGWLSPAVLLVCVLLLAAGAWRVASPGIAASRRPPPLRLALRWPLLPAAALVAGDLCTALPTPPSSWDAMTYHLYLPARWLAAGEWIHVPTVFSDNSAAFAAHNGALFFTWHLGLAGHDALVTALQLLMLVFLALAIYRLARLLGVPPQGALMGGATVFALAPLRQWATTANVDVFMVALWGAGVYWLVALALRRQKGAAWAAALALGLAAGTKTVGLPLAAPPLAVLALLLAWRRRWLELLGCGLAVMASGGFWYARNWALYGNPLFPLDWSLPGWHFAGAYSSAAVRQSQFNIDFERWREVVRLTWGDAAIGLVLLAVLALLVRGLGAVSDARRRRAGLVQLALALFAVFWIWFAFAVVPHNNQTRFLLPALVAALPGWALLLGRLGRRLRAVVFVVFYGVALYDARPDVAWRFVFERLEAAGVAVVGWLLICLASGLVALWAFGRARQHRRWLAAGWVALLPLAGYAAAHADASRNAFLSVADFRVWRGGYLLFNDPATPPTRVAYSGGNVPYALIGPGLRHHVVYCNTRGTPEDGFYDFWNRDRRLHRLYKPGLYRGPGDEHATWRACLEQEGIEAVALFRLFPVETPEEWPRDGDFPIERRWMRERPELYEPFFRSAYAEIYWLR